jgi:hypothetical protein
MIRAGVLREDQRLERLDGEIYEMTPIGPRHNSVVDRLTRFWVTRLGERAIVRVQGSVTAGPRSCGSTPPPASPRCCPPLTRTR